MEARFNRITEDHGWSPANRAMSLLRSVYRRPCVDLEGLRNPVKRLVNHARPNDVTEGYAADWTVRQLREPAQRIADRIEALMNGELDPAIAAV